MNLTERLRKDLPRDAVVDAVASYEGAFPEAWSSVKPLGLSSRRAARSAGFVRSQIVEERFAQLHDMHSAVTLPAGLIPNTEARIFQPYGVYGRTLLGWAAMQEAGELPKKNLTRGNTAAIINGWMEPGLFEEPRACPEIDQCALILASREPGVVDRPAEMAIAVISPSYDRFMLYMRIDDFLAGYAPATVAPAPDDGPIEGLKLRTRRDADGRRDTGAR